ncbi:hypothetical protein, partial [Pseudomonas aeruginosa]
FYDAGGRLVREVTKSATGGQARAIVYAYDDLDRLVRKTIQRKVPPARQWKTIRFSHMQMNSTPIF